LTKYWLCFLTDKNWQIVKKEGIHGVPDKKKAAATIKSIEKDDILVFYLISPVRAIKGIGKAVSEAFEERERRLWKDRLYPHRIKISLLDTDIHIPLSGIKGKIGAIKTRIPMGVSIIPLSEKDFETIRTLKKSKIV